MKEESIIPAILFGLAGSQVGVGTGQNGTGRGRDGEGQGRTGRGKHEAGLQRVPLTCVTAAHTTKSLICTNTGK